MNKYLKTLNMSFHDKLNGGIFYQLPEVFIQAATMGVMMLLWNTLLDQGVAADMTKPQMLTYTFVSFALSELLNIRSFLTAWNYDGQLISLCNRPMGMFLQVIAQTLGELSPRLLFFVLPMACIMPLFGVVVLPDSPLFFVSLVLSVSLGFALEICFACVGIRLRNIWIITVIRTAIANVLSGALIPFSLMPFGIGDMLKYQPFGSLANAPLNIFIGTQDANTLLLIQLIWNTALWPFAFMFWNKSREHMVSYGG
jgi:ABC-2 type transport system permease protein